MPADGIVRGKPEEGVERDRGERRQGLPDIEVTEPWDNGQRPREPRALARKVLEGLRPREELPARGKRGGEVPAFERDRRMPQGQCGPPQRVICPREVVL